jgi:DNA-binding NarL/FixJ family response regulator
MADDHPVLLAGMKALLQTDQGLRLVGEARDGQAALYLVRLLHPDVAVLDISMPRMSGVEVCKVLRAEAPDVRVLILSVHEGRTYQRELLEAGAAAYLSKRSAADQLIPAIHAVAAGIRYRDPLLEDGANEPLPPAAAGEAVELSGQDAAVLRLVAAGHSNREIAARMGLGVQLVQSSKLRMMAKLGLGSRIDVVRYATKLGWPADE